MVKDSTVIEYGEYGLTQKEAFGKIKNIFNDAVKEHGDMIKNLKQEWNEKDYKGKASFSVNVKVKGIPISGNLTGEIEVNQKNMKLIVDFPAAALPLKGQAIEMLRNGAKTLLKRKQQ